MGLGEYARRRNFAKTPEPRSGKVRAGRKKALAYVIQKHAASRLHYDFRLEHEGVLLSWAVPKGPSLDPRDKRLAVRVEDHPLAYGKFEGTIPRGEYGGGTVMLWDRGTWTPDGDVGAGLAQGKLEFELHGERLTGSWRLIRLGGKRAGDEKNWLLMKRTDDEARPASADEIVEREARSISTGRGMAEIAAGKPARKKRARRAKKVRTKSSAKRTASRSVWDPKQLSGARKAALPEFVEPQLATLQDDAPDGEDWIHEIKFDGYRMLARVQNGVTRWISRNGLDWSDRFPDLSDELSALAARTALLDGEVVVLKKNGVSDFQELQQALGDGTKPFTFFAFDLLHLDGYDLRACPLLERKRALAALLGEGGRFVRFSEHVAGNGDDFHARACRAGLEGIVSKLGSASYSSGRTRDWIKTKCSLRQEFVIAGFTRPGGSRTGFGSLVLGVHQGKKLVHAGRVGTGFDRRLLTSLSKRMRTLRVHAPPFADSSGLGPSADVTWIAPRLVAEVAFTGWTSDGLLRHPRFVGMREDKPARDVVRERALHRRGAALSVRTPKRAPAARAKKAPAEAAGSQRVGGIAITHPDRVLEDSAGTTKLDVARYYERVADRILLHAGNRPLSVLRCPSGFSGACFFQKHGGAGVSADVRAIALEDSKGGSEYLYVTNKKGLLGLVQLNAVEIHPWGCRVDKPERPDRICMDLDPAPDVAFARVVEAALILREVLEKLELEPFLKTTGGKGLHVVLPLVRRYEWDEVREFARALARAMTAVEPKLYVDVASKSRRSGRIFVDYLRNGRGATAVAPYSVRARPFAPIATPLRWEELESLRAADTFRVGNIEARLKKLRADPWARMDAAARALPSAKSVKSL
jgi:bifunctional non-homologous end joining protein LigD